MYILAGSGDKPLVRFARDLGIALAIAAVIALVLERLIHESLLRDMHRAANEMISKSDVLRGASELKIHSVFARRHQSTHRRWEIEVGSAIQKELSRDGGEVLIACVAAPEFFRQGTQVATTLLDKMHLKGNCELRVLLLCPDSQWANLRAEFEPLHPTITDIENAAHFLKSLQDQAGNKVKVHCYDLPPIAFLVITEDLLFLEAYPLVRVHSGDGPIGGVTPMIVIERAGSDAYKRWHGHFDEIWKNHSAPYHEHHGRKP